MKLRSLAKMKKILVQNSVIVCCVYIAVGFFGYVTWVAHSDVNAIVQSQNILLAPYEGIFVNTIP